MAERGEEGGGEVGRAGSPPTTPTAETEKPVETAADELENLKKALEDERARLNVYMNRMKYLQADFENLQKKMKREVEEGVRREEERLIARLLDVLDDLERAVEAGRGSGEKEAVTSGVEMVLKRFQRILEEEGLARVEAAGKPFDPRLHEAVEEALVDDVPENTVVAELRKGYLLKGRVIRSSMVRVARSPGKEKGCCEDSHV